MKTFLNSSLVLKKIIIIIISVIILSCVFSCLEEKEIEIKKIDIKIEILFNKKSLKVNTYIPYDKVIELLSDGEINDKENINIKDYAKLMNDYLKKKFTVNNNNVEMVYRPRDIVPQNNEEIKINGLKIEFLYKSKEKIGKLKFLYNEVDYTSNKIEIFDVTNLNEEPLVNFTLDDTNKGFEAVFDIPDIKTIVLTDCKYIEQDEEIELRDEEEISNDDIHIFSEKRDGDYNPGDTGINKEGISTDFLSKTLNKLNDTLSGKASPLEVFILFLFVFILGVLHSAIEAGHGKTILISHLVDGNKGFFSGFIFSLFMSFTHILDVLIVGAIFYFISLRFDLSQYINYIQLIAMSILFVIAIFLLVRAIYNVYKQKKKEMKTDDSIQSDSEKTTTSFNNEDKKKSKGMKSTILLAILSGIAPCSFGWAIMLTIITLKKLEWIFPIITVFGLGIFSVLISLSFLIIFVKNKSISKIGKVSKYLPIVSALLLIIFSSIIIIRTLFSF